MPLLSVLCEKIDTVVKAVTPHERIIPIPIPGQSFRRVVPGRGGVTHVLVKESEKGKRAKFKSREIVRLGNFGGLGSEFAGGLVVQIQADGRLKRELCQQPRVPARYAGIASRAGLVPTACHLMGELVGVARLKLGEQLTRLVSGAAEKECCLCGSPARMVDIR